MPASFSFHNPAVATVKPEADEDWGREHRR
jgi:hypothetical protein